MATGPGSEIAGAAPVNDPLIETVVLQPTNFCNIACTYCYLPGRDQRGVMEQGTVRLIFERIFDSGFAAPEVTVIWHAGEPLAAGVAFYQQAFETIEQLRPKTVEIIHSFQTNGMLLSKAWCDLIEQWKVNVGVSIDGPKEINDANRVTRKGLGTFDSTMAGIKLLQSRDIPFHTLSVLTAKSLSDPEGMYRFFRDAGIQQVCFNVEESEGEHVSDLLHEADLDGIYRRFLEIFWGLARADGDVGYLREIDGMIPRIVRSADMHFRNPQTEPLAMVNIDRFGHVSTFSPELLGYENAEYDNFIIGDVHKQSLREMYEACARSPLNAAIQKGVQRCKEECGYFAVCGGGAPVNKLYEAGSFEATKTGYCKLTQMIPTDIILDALDRLPQKDLREFAKAG